MIQRNKTEMLSRRKRIFIDFAVPMVLLGAVTLVFWLTDIDIEYQRLFFDEEQGTFEKDTQPWKLIYRMSPIPPMIVFLTACVVLVAGLLTKRLAKYRRICIFAFLVMILGPGLIVNCVLKMLIARERS